MESSFNSSEATEWLESEEGQKTFRKIPIIWVGETLFSLKDDIENPTAWEHPSMAMTMKYRATPLSR